MAHQQACDLMAMLGPNRQSLQPGALYSNTQVQEWLSPAGQRKSMPTNCRDDPTIINNNTLRSTRSVGSSRYALTGSNPAAGNHFSACTLVDNWSEEQTSSKYAPHNTYRLQPPDRSTEYRECVSTAAAEQQKQLRMRQLQQCYLTPCRKSSRPSSAPQYKAASAASSSTLAAHERSSSSSSFGSSSRPYSSSSSDHANVCHVVAAGHLSSVQHSNGTLPQRPQSSSSWAACCSKGLLQQQQQQQWGQAKGMSTGSRRCWSASAASTESVARTMLGRQQHLEFQDPPVGGARGKVLANTDSMKQRDAALAAACSARLQANRQATSRWASMYSKEYLQQEWVTRFERVRQQQQQQEQQ